jgi:hypothetical protein
MYDLPFSKEKGKNSDFGRYNAFRFFLTACHRTGVGVENKDDEPHSLWIPVSFTQ